MKAIRSFMAVIMMLCAACAAFADTNITPARAGDGVGSGRSELGKAATAKCQRGLKKLLFGWTEIPQAIADKIREDKNPITGIIGGTVHGVSRALPKTLSGLMDVVTCPASGKNAPTISEDPILK